MTPPPGRRVGSAAAIELKGVTKRFAAVTAVDDLSLDVQPGEIFGLVGPDGAGKSTTMRMLAGVMRPDSGTVLVGGVDVAANPEMARQDISYMPQRFGLYEDLTVEENIRFFADLFGIPGRLREERSARLLAAAGMTPFRKRLAGQLSGGMKQKLGLACALIHTPRTVLLDEPTTGVDPLSRHDFWAILTTLRDEGVSIVISTAYLDEAERCHRLALLHRGRMIECGTPDALKATMPGCVIAITTAAARAARDALADSEGVTAAWLVGDGVHVHVDDGTARLPALRLRLAQAAIAVSEMEIVAPSIEDLFVTLLDRPEDGGDG